MAQHQGRRTRRTAGRHHWLVLVALLAGWWLSAGAQPGKPAAPGPGGTARLLPPPASVPLAGPLTLALRLPAPAPAQRPQFPDIEGFRKERLVTTTTTRLLPGGQRRTELTYSQRYYPYAEGAYIIPAFDVLLGGQVLHSPAAQVQVGAAAPGAAQGPLPGSGTGAGGAPAAVGSLDQLLGKPKASNFYEPADHAYLALEAEPARVYVGQGVRVVLSLYLEPADQLVLNFYDFQNQLGELRQQLRQPRAIQASAPDPAALPDTVRRPGRPPLLRFRLLDNTYYPLTAQPLRFPGLSLTLTKFRLLRNPQPGDTERLAGYKTYRTEPLRVAVRPLPGPAADSAAVAVGDYGLRESLSTARPRTGEAFTYSFGVEGDGNAAAVLPRLAARPSGLAVYGPDLSEVSLAGGRWRKTFRYRLVASRPGPVALSRLVQLPFFNPATARYDTLRPALQAQVRGEALPTAARPADDPFYGPALARADPRLQPLDVYQQVGRYATWVLAGLLGVAVVGWWRAGRREG